MLKFFSSVGFLLIYLSASAQKASYYIDRSVDLNSFNYFYIEDSLTDVHDLTSPYLIKSNLKSNQMSTFILYNELSLKNLTIIDDHADIGTLLIHFYEDIKFDPLVKTPTGYKSKKLAKKSFVIDMVNGGTGQLVWRGWIDQKKIRATDDYQRYQKGITCILKNFLIQPVIHE